MLILNWDVDYEGDKGDSRVSSYVEGFYVAVEVVIQEGDVFWGGKIMFGFGYVRAEVLVRRVAFGNISWEYRILELEIENGGLFL